MINYIVYILIVAILILVIIVAIKALNRGIEAKQKIMKEKKYTKKNNLKD